MIRYLFNHTSNIVNSPFLETVLTDPSKHVLIGIINERKSIQLLPD